MAFLPLNNDKVHVCTRNDRTSTNGLQNNKNKTAQVFHRSIPHALFV